MKCQKCQTDNKEEAKFCRKCGSKLLKICPQCGSENLPEDNFCDQCGNNFAIPIEPTRKELSFDQKIARIQRYLPMGLTDKILSQRDKIEGERKQVTVMFCDMVGFTALSERLGLEEAYAVMDKVYEILIHKVHDYEGTVNEMKGDGIIALFGAPIALEDAPQRAIRSAYAIHREMVKFSEQIRQEQKGMPPIKMRIGIHTGPVIVGTLGNDLRVEFKAVGDTVNMGSRMEELAQPGTTYVTKDIFRLTEGFFRFEALGDREVKGKQKPVEIYRVIAPSTRKTRFDVGAERGLTPFVGRERELELLLDGFESAKKGRGQAFSIMAEVGVGKSRLLYEFRKAIVNEDVTFLEGKCLSYGRGIAYHPITDILKSNFDIREDDRDCEITEKVRKGLKVLGADEASTLPYLLELLSVEDSGIDQLPMSPEARKDRILGALKRIIMKGSEIRPLIMAIEDLHWIDKSSEDSLKDVLDSISGARVLLIFTYRLEFVPTWGGRSYHSQMTLNRLSNRESLTMATHLLGNEDLDVGLEELILDKTEGVPFFIEEFIKSLKDLNIIERKDNKYCLAKDIQELAIPATIHDVIMARVDLLPEGAKEVFQTGSVIERDFSYELIKQVTALPEQELLSHLSVLKDVELLYERGIYPESTYIFKHALTREVVYDSILSKKRKRLHGEIGEAIEDLCKQNIGEQYGALAEHFIKSENYEKGSEYSKLAGKKAAKAASYTDAIEHAKKSVFCLERLAKTAATQRKIIDARTALSGYYNRLTRPLEAKEAVAPIVDLAMELNYLSAFPGIYTAFGLHSLWVEEDYSKGCEHLDKVLNVSKETRDYIYEYLARFFLGVAFCWFNCEFEKSLEYLKKSMDLSLSMNDLVGISFANGWCAQNYVFQGKIGLAHKLSKKSIDIAIESGDIYVKGMAYSSYGTCCYFRGLYDEGEDNLLKGLVFCEKTGEVAWGALASGWLGFIYSDMGEYQKSENYYKRAIEILESNSILPSWVNMWKVSISKAKILNQDKDISLNELFKYYKNNKLKILEGWMARFIGEILLNIDGNHVSEAADWAKKAIEMDKKNGVKLSLGQNHKFYAELFKRMGDQAKVREHLGKAVEAFRECGAEGYQRKAEKDLSSLS
jgi:class 3 adenylate cyclase/tetratricopeptide (TPR) repeat protein